MGSFQPDGFKKHHISYGVRQIAWSIILGTVSLCIMARHSIAEGLGRIHGTGVLHFDLPTFNHVYFGGI